MTERGHDPRAPGMGTLFIPMTRAQRAAVVGSFALFFAAASILAFRNGTPGTTWVVPALALHLTLRVLPIALYGGRLGWLHPVTYVLLMGAFQLATRFHVFAFGLTSHIALPDLGEEALARLVAYDLVLLSGGLVAYYAGLGARAPLPAPRLRLATPARLPWRAAGVVAVAVVVFALYMASQGGIRAHIVSWGLSRHVAVAGEAYWHIAVSAGSYACLLWLAFAPTPLLRRPALLASSAACLVMTFLLHGSRSNGIYLIMMGFVVYMLRTRRIPFRAVALLIVVALMMLSILGEVRTSTRSGSVRWTSLTRPAPAHALAEGLREMGGRGGEVSGVYPILARVPHRVGLLYGESYLALLTLPVPRSLWPGKPGLIDGRVRRAFFDTRKPGGIPAGAVGEAYWNFHIPGVLLVFLLFGIFHGWLARLYRRHADHPAAAVFFAATLVSFAPSTMGVATWAMAVVPLSAVAVAMGVVRWRRKAAEA